MIEVMLYSAAAIFVYMVVVFFWATLIKDNSIVDIGWGMGFLVVISTGLLLLPAINTFHAALVAMVFIWGLRLSGYIFSRHRNVGEDYRYVQWRKEWGKYVVPRAFFQIFMLQGGFMYIIALPLMIAVANPSAVINWVSITGIVLWLIGFLFEAVGDYQKSQFKANQANSGKIMQSGLWRYTRHPNYFGEVLLWWGIWVFVLPAGYWYVTIISPIILTFLLTKVSGVAMLEKKYAGNKEFEEYARKTNGFIPWWPKR
jgi:steroid 5-alpha reductase family enzyme